ncbi:DsbA family protein [Mycobacterium sp. 1245852.3]|uniref:DsbA family oxidoreductase n=1 Tax=Mycobacterium sp. 1245852.3 TaxID=1856860 RepID=UPI0009EE503A|nr:DsbA family protein [Mycobacterium sp. 1245852.3]
MSDVGDDVRVRALHWYDLTCPFCYIGQNRTAVLADAGVAVISLPFQAHPEIPPAGLVVGPRRGRRSKMIEREAEGEGLMLHWPLRIPNSRKALAAAEWVRRNQPSAFAEVQSKLFEAHFVLGEDINDQAVIDRHAANAGVELSALRTALADGSAYAAVDQAERAADECGVYGTPAWLLEGRLISGLLPISEFERVGRDALSQRQPSERNHQWQRLM